MESAKVQDSVPALKVTTNLKIPTSASQFVILHVKIAVVLAQIPANVSKDINSLMNLLYATPYVTHSI